VGMRITGLAISCLLILLTFPVFATPARAGSDLRSRLESPLASEGDGVHHLGLKPSPSEGVPQAGLPRSYSLGKTLGASADLSAQLPPVGDQGVQGSCTAWATSYYYKSWSEKQEHTSWNLGDSFYQFSPSFMYNQINDGVDEGSNFYDALSLLQNTGDVDIAEMPYNQYNYTLQPTAAQKEAAKPYRIPSGWGYLWNNSYDSPYSPPNNISSAKAWLDSGQPLVMGLPIYGDFPDYYEGPAAYYDYDETSGMLGGHGVCICGYDDNANSGGSDADHKGGFKMVNSWGTGWNGGGFVYLSYDFVKRYVYEAWTMGDLSGDGPSISSLSKSSGSVGDSIYINGNNFGMNRRNARVTFNGTTATQVSFTNSRVTVTVPTGATTGSVIVYDWEGTASNSVTFTVGEKVVKPPPTISSITPNTATRGTTVRITNLAGAGFQQGGTTVVKLRKSGAGDITATGVSVQSANKITCQFSIPSNAPGGPWNLHVRNPDGQAATRSNAFTVSSAEVTYPTWYLAEGSSDWGFSTYISIGNPNSTPVSAQITYMTPTGQVPGGTVNMPAKSQATVNPADTVGVKDFSTKVVCLEGKTICVDRTMSWTGLGASVPEAHSSVGVTSPAKTWYLAEGSSKWGFETWLLIQNPNADSASVTLTYMIEGAPPVSVAKTVPGNSRRSFNMAQDIGERDASIKVTGNLPVIAERAMYRYNRREGHDSIGTTTPALDYYLAEGSTAWDFTTYLLVQNPNNQPSNVAITLMTDKGPQTLPAFSLPANSRKTIRVNDLLPGKDFSTRVHGSRPIIAERSMYWNSPAGEACHDSIGLSAPHTVFYLADGQSSEGRETYTLVQNPNPGAVTVEVSYLTPDGAENRSFTDTIPGNSRRSYNMANVIPSRRASVVVNCKTSGKKIIVERAMYWNSRSAGTDTIGGYSD